MAALAITAQASSPAVTDISSDWAYREDLKEAGLGSKWHHPLCPDAKWSRTWGASPEALFIKPSKRKAKPASGRMWFRKWVDIPAGAPPRLFLSVSAPGAAVDVFINGVWVGKSLAPGRPAVLEGTRALASGEGRFLVALRLKKTRDAGAGPARVTTVFSQDSRPVFEGTGDWLEFLARESPTLGWPEWMLGRTGVRSSAGLPDGSAACAVGNGGQVVPPGAPFTVSCWIYDRGSKKFFAADSLPGRQSLDERTLPVPISVVRMGRYNLFVRVWAEEVEGHPGVAVAVGEVTLENESDRTRQVDLVIAVHPFLPWRAGTASGAARVDSVEYAAASRCIIVNGRPAVVLTAPADRFVAAPFIEGTIARTVALGESAETAKAEDPALGLASGGAVYGLKIQPFGARTRTFRVFIAGGPERVTPDYTQGMREETAKWSYRGARDAWRELIVGKDRIYLRVPDKRAQDSFYAGIGYLLAGAGDAARAGRGTIRLAAEALRKTGHPGPATALEAAPGASSTLVPEPAVPPGSERSADRFVRARELLAISATPAEQAINWAMKHQNSPNAFAWGGQVDSVTGKWTGGALPDLAASAAFILLVRDMFVRESGDSLELAPSIPPGWLKSRQFLEIKNVPTGLGPLGYSLTVRDQGFVLNIHQAPPAQGGITWRVPGKKRIGKLVVDGTRAEIPPDRVVTVPQGAKRVVVSW